MSWIQHKCKWSISCRASYPWEGVLLVLSHSSLCQDLDTDLQEQSFKSLQALKKAPENKTKKPQPNQKTTNPHGLTTQILPPTDDETCSLRTSWERPGSHSCWWVGTALTPLALVVHPGILHAQSIKEDECVQCSSAWEGWRSQYVQTQFIYHAATAAASGFHLQRVQWAYLAIGCTETWHGKRERQHTLMFFHSTLAYWRTISTLHF